MSVVLPFLSFIGLFCGFLVRSGDWRRSTLVTATVWGTQLAAMTEILSFFNLIAPIPIAVGWIIFAGAGVAFSAWTCTRHRSALQIRRMFFSLHWLTTVLAFVAAGLLVVLAIIALTAAPSSGDALQYHLPRVMHWLQNHNVAHYPTWIQRQNYLSPWGSYAILHFQALLGNDYLSNSIQWFSLVLAVIAGSRIAKQLGVSSAGQVITGVLICTTPMALLQSTQAGNQLVIAAWMTCFVSLAIDSMDSGVAWQSVLADSALAGIALGLAILTKATAYFFAFPFVVWLAISLFRRWGIKSWQALTAVAVIALSINAADYARQTRSYGSPLGLGKEDAVLGLAAETYSNEIHTPNAILSNLLRNVALELEMPSESYSRAMVGAVRWMHKLLWISPDDRRTTWTVSPFAIAHEGWNDETSAASPFQFLLILGSLGFILSSKSATTAGRVYAMCIVAGFMAFCLMLKWNPWLSRLHLPLFCLALPLVSLMLDRLRSHWLGFATAVMAIAIAIPCIAFAKFRPLIGANAYFNKPRLIQYYMMIGEPLADIHAQIADRCEPVHPKFVGLQLGRDDAEYGLWVTFHSKGLYPRFEHFGVSNESSRYYETLTPGTPEIVVTAKLHINEFRVDRTVTE